MTDTRKDFEATFEELLKENIGANAYERMYIAWQACQQLNDKRIADLLAVIEKKDEAMSALINYVDAQKAMSEHKTVSEVRKALAIKPEDVERFVGSRVQMEVVRLSEVELIEFAVEEEFLLFCSEEEFVDIANALMDKMTGGKKCPTGDGEKQ